MKNTRFRFVFLWLALVCRSVTPVFAQETKAKPARILFLVDASSSMLHPWEGQESRFDAASRIIISIIDSISAVNNEVAFGVRVFGAQYPAQDENCFDSKMEVSFAYQNKAQIQARLRHIRPFGYSPIAWSLKETAEKDFQDADQYAYSIILLTDGGESCGGDICATVNNLLAKKISFKPFVLSLIDYEPLKLEYDCFANFMVVSREKNIQPAIKKIIDDNRSVLSVRSTNLLARQPTTPIPNRVAPTPKRTEVQAQPAKEEPSKTPVQQAPPLQERTVQRAKSPVLTIANVQKPRRFNLLFALEAGKTVPVPRFSPVQLDLPEEAPNKPAVATAVRETPKRPAAAPPPRPARNENVLLEVKTEDAQETKLQIYFTDGRGKFYSTEPKIVIRNRKDGESKTLYRNMSGSEPSPINIAQGVYDISIPGSNATASNVQILEGKTNKVYIKAEKGSIAFAHPTAPDKPIEGYYALVSKRFERGSEVIKQQCDELLPYEPANYHIEINTLPPLVYNVTLNFDERKILAIPEPGVVQFTNTEKVGKVQLWHELGNQFMPFYDLMINGDLNAQKVELLPGKYQVRYYKLPVQPYQKAEMIPFSILGKETTSVHLNL